MATATEPTALLDTFRQVAALSRNADVSFDVGSGMAVWAHGGPLTEHDIDLFMTRDESERAVDVLRDAGFSTMYPPEGWLAKAWRDGVLVDLIFRPIGLEITEGTMASCPVLDVHAVPVRVLPVDDVIATKLLALSEHNLDFGPVLACEPGWNRRSTNGWTTFHPSTR